MELLWPAFTKEWLSRASEQLDTTSHADECSGYIATWVTRQEEPAATDVQGGDADYARDVQASSYAIREEYCRSGEIYARELQFGKDNVGE